MAKNWKSEVRYHTQMIEMYLGTIERGYDATGNIQYHLLKIQDILLDVPPEERMTTREYLVEQLKEHSL